MKKVFAVFMILALCLTFVPAAMAADTNDNYRVVSETKETLPDGTVVTVRVRVQPVLTRGRVYNVNGAKDYIYGSDWTFTVYGTFTVNEGVSATCIADSYSVSISNSEWRKQQGSSGHGGNTAYASGTMSRYFAGAVVQNIYPSVSVSCNSYGQFS